MKKNLLNSVGLIKTERDDLQGGFRALGKEASIDTDRAFAGHWQAIQQRLAKEVVPKTEDE